MTRVDLVVESSFQMVPPMENITKPPNLEVWKELEEYKCARRP